MEHDTTIPMCFSCQKFLCERSKSLVGAALLPDALLHYVPGRKMFRSPW